MGYEINSYPYPRQDSLYNAYMYQFANPNISNNIPMQYGYYNLQNTTPSFKGGYTTQPDTFSASNQLQPKKEGMSTGAKLGIGAVIATGVGLGIWALSRGRGSSKVAKETENKITKIFKENLVQSKFSTDLKFQEAKTIEDARKFTTDILGIKTVDDTLPLEVLNRINSELVDVIHYQKGNLLMPKALRYYAMEGNDKLTGALVKSHPLNNDFLELHVNKRAYDKDSIIEHISESLFYEDGNKVFNMLGDKITIPIVHGLPLYPTKQAQALIKKFYSAKQSMTLDELRMLQHSLSEAGRFTELVSSNPLAAMDLLKCNLNKNILKTKSIEEQRKTLLDYIAKNGIKYKLYLGNDAPNIYHEMGHLQDDYKNMSALWFKNNEWQSRMCQKTPLEKYLTSKTSEIKNNYPDFYEFINTSEIQATAGRVSGYAQEGISEFIAETYARLVQGKNLPDDVIALYKKYGGPTLS